MARLTSQMRVITGRSRRGEGCWEPFTDENRPRCMTQTGPFLGTEALARGAVTKRTLISRHDRIYRGVYQPKGVELTPARRAVAAWLWSGRQATVAGLSAAALYGAGWIDQRLPAELYRRNGKPVDGILIHRDALLADETRLIRGISATTRRARGRS